MEIRMYFCFTEKESCFVGDKEDLRCDPGLWRDRLPEPKLAKNADMIRK
ncbi:hypothetical protein SAMN05216420_101106 [Nitrosospira sp. Nl5]|nr:hypothetical protein SAMN05216420_101106 [Nitrosospira sp. Nl5]